ncbi:hypothetical protein ST201phi2-1p340 [Pseudomonas phage 201phi2-1]|uniref:Uncharacterized protein n=1 Tax=Pseudomonas phage 201phi2-1 TaxID=198110 RepID=B3FJK0_BP201|nr:hypothetical protein ST201phi2-1p340 [Pseudomonas phage 201phi2-1]ABY63165.1 hypothetical protein 201phi2-1p340 [Pseudomonas phage 201phi2-1]
MNDLWELLKKVFCSKRSEGHHKKLHDACTRKPLPDKAPPGPPKINKVTTVRLEVDMAKQTKKDKIVELERELKDLRQQSENQTALLEVIVKELSGLRRDLSHLLPEK